MPTTTRSTLRPRVLVLCSLGPRFETIARREGYLLHPDGTIDDAADLADVRAIVLRSGVTVDRALLARLPSLERVIRAGSGVDNIDVEALREASVELVLRKGASAPAVAELTTAALLSLARRVPEGASSLRAGGWWKSRLMGERASELDVVIWGAGPVGRACGAALAPIVRRVTFAAWPSALDVPTVPPPDALERADVHVLCLPLRAATRGIFGPDALDRMATARPYLLNVGRLGLMDREAVVGRLAAGGLRGVFVDAIDGDDVAWARDVSTREPLNLLISPHLGAQRDDVLDGLAEWVMTELAAVEHAG